MLYVSQTATTCYFIINLISKTSKTFIGEVKTLSFTALLRRHSFNQADYSLTVGGKLSVSGEKPSDLSFPLVTQGDLNLSVMYENEG